MEALILAAGYGNRMKPLTDSTHKTMLEIDGVTIMDRILESLSSCKVKKIYVVTGYLAEELEGYITQRYASRLDVHFVRNPRYRETNNIFSMHLAFEAMDLKDDLLFIESDLIFDPRVMDCLLESSFQNVALVSPYKRGMDGTVVALQGNVIADVIPSYRQKHNFDFSDKYKTVNIYKFEKEFCKKEFKKLLSFYANNFDDNCYYELILGMLVYMQRETIFAEVIPASWWAEVDDPNDLKIASYQFGKNKKKDILDASFGGFWNYDVKDFCFIRNMHFPPPGMMAELKTQLPELLYNYGSKQSLLNEKLAYLIEADSSSLLALNGASQAYPWLKELFVGKVGLIPKPTFGEYEQLFSDTIAYKDEGALDARPWEAFLGVSDVVVFVNPNNPTGTLTSPDHIAWCVRQYPHKIFLVDESFLAFAQADSVIGRIPDAQNVIVLCSMSKTYGVPGMRLGYLYTKNKDYLDFFKQLTPIWNMNSVAEFFMEIGLKHKPALQRSFQKTIEERTEFAAALSDQVLVDRVYKSYGNFILVRLTLDLEGGKTLTSELLERYQIYVKDISHKCDDPRTHLRLAVRTQEDHNYFLKALNELSCLRLG